MRKLTKEEVAEVQATVTAHAKEVEKSEPNGGVILEVADVIQGVLSQNGIDPAMGKTALELVLFGIMAYLEKREQVGANTAETTNEQG